LDVPSIAMNNHGDFVIAWQRTLYYTTIVDIFAQRFDKNGNKSGDNFQVNTYTDLYQGAPSAASDSDGNFVITWESQDQDGWSYGIYAQKFDKEGNKIGDEFRVNTYTYDEQQHPSATMDVSGNFVITWESYFQDHYGWGIYAKLFSETTTDPIKFALHKEPDETTYQKGDNIKISADIRTLSKQVNADIYFVMRGSAIRFYYGLLWDMTPSAVLKNFKIPANLSITDASLIDINIPSIKPPIRDTGTYTFFIAATEPATGNLISNIASASFVVQ
jgi:hypothetical protein